MHGNIKNKYYCLKTKTVLCTFPNYNNIIAWIKRRDIVIEVIYQNNQRSSRLQTKRILSVQVTTDSCLDCANIVQIERW